MSRILSFVAAGVLSTALASSAFASSGSRATTEQQHPGYRYANTGLVGRGTVAVPVATDREGPYALTGRAVEQREFQTIRIGSRVVAIVPVDGDNR